MRRNFHSKYTYEYTYKKSILYKSKNTQNILYTHRKFRQRICCKEYFAPNSKWPKAKLLRSVFLYFCNIATLVLNILLEQS